MPALTRPAMTTTRREGSLIPDSVACELCEARVLRLAPDQSGELHCAGVIVCDEVAEGLGAGMCEARHVRRLLQR